MPSIVAIKKHERYECHVHVDPALHERPMAVALE